MTSYSNMPQLPDMGVSLEDFINGDEVVKILLINMNLWEKSN